jgi:hypothetical protein
VKHIRGAILLLCTIAVSSFTVATTIIPLTVEQLAGKSSSVVRGRAMEIWTQWNPQHTLIYTYTRFQVVKSFKGASDQTITVKQIGGRVGNTVQKAAGVRHFTGGEEDILFLRPSEENDGALVVTGLVQGNFRLYRAVSGEIRATNGVPEVSTLQVGTGNFSAYRGSAMRVNELESRIQKAVQQ